MLLAMPLTVFGGNYLLHLFALPGDGGLMKVVAFGHVAVGAPWQLPISIGIVAFSFTMSMPGSQPEPCSG